MKSEDSYIQQLAGYIRRNLTKGYTIDSLRYALESQDYSRISVDRAIKLANEQLAKTAPVMKEKPRIKYNVVDKLPEKKSFFKKLFG
tara:strand:+ start:52 stop:312 length:261 start_codon:yes stop_codon:yes gene_type:complete